MKRQAGPRVAGEGGVAAMKRQAGQIFARASSPSDSVLSRGGGGGGHGGGGRGGGMGPGARGGGMGPGGGGRGGGMGPGGGGRGGGMGPGGGARPGRGAGPGGRGPGGGMGPGGPGGGARPGRGAGPGGRGPGGGMGPGGPGGGARPGRGAGPGGRGPGGGMGPGVPGGGARPGRGAGPGGRGAGPGHGAAPMHGGGHHGGHHGHHGHHGGHVSPAWYGGWGGPIWWGGWGGWGWWNWPWSYAWAAPYEGCNIGGLDAFQAPVVAADYLADNFGNMSWWREVKVDTGEDGSAILNVLVSDNNAARSLPSSVCGYPVVVTTVGSKPGSLSMGLGELPSDAACPYGWSYSDQAGCVSPDGTTLASPSCSTPGTTWDSATLTCLSTVQPPQGTTCPAGYTYHPDDAYCHEVTGPGQPSKMIEPTCLAASLTWSLDTRACVASTPAPTTTQLPAGKRCPGDGSGWQYMSDGLCHMIVGPDYSEAMLPPTPPLDIVGPLPLPPPQPQQPPPQLPPGAHCAAGSFTGKQCVSMSPGITGVMSKVDPTCDGGATWDPTALSCAPAPATADEEPKKASIVSWLVGGSIIVVAVGLVFATLSIKPPPKLTPA